MLLLTISNQHLTSEFGEKCYKPLRVKRCERLHLLGESAMKKASSSLSDSECLETLVRSLLESTDMSVDEILQVTGRLFGTSPHDVGRLLNVNPFRPEQMTLQDLIGEAVLNTVRNPEEK